MTTHFQEGQQAALSVVLIQFQTIREYRLIRYESLIVFDRTYVYTERIPIRWFFQINLLRFNKLNVLQHICGVFSG